MLASARPRRRARVVLSALASLAGASCGDGDAAWLPTAPAPPLAPVAPVAPVSAVAERAAVPAPAPRTDGPDFRMLRGDGITLGGGPARPTDAFDPAAVFADARCLADGSAQGDWTVRFNGYGCTLIGATPLAPAFSLRPQAAERAPDTHAQLVLGPTQGAALTYRVRVLTTAQLRRGDAPNPWEVAWVVWHYGDDDHFYYFIPKPNGWELGKRDPGYPGGQRFLASGDAQRFPIGAWYDVAIVQRGNEIVVTVDGRALVRFVDDERPYAAGRIGLYTEDAAVLARDARVD